MALLYRVAPQCFTLYNDQNGICHSSVYVIKCENIVLVVPLGTTRSLLKKLGPGSTAALLLHLVSRSTRALGSHSWIIQLHRVLLVLASSVIPELIIVLSFIWYTVKYNTYHQL